jgi:hypothetical protein
MKNGPEIVNFRPALWSLATLANRRLQPLGHLTPRLGPSVGEGLAQGKPQTVSVREIAFAGSKLFWGTHNGFQTVAFVEFVCKIGPILR